MTKHIHIHVGRKAKDATPEVEEAYQAIARARKRAQELVDKLTTAMERTKAGRGVMTPELARQVEVAVLSVIYKVV